jgi:uncharacterized protein YjaZ
MLKYHGSNDESAFFQHELFHTYHSKVMRGCDDNLVWATLWTEGLATYVSKVMAPAASENEMLLEIPAGMAERTRAALPAAFAQLEQVLGSDDRSTREGLFQTRGNDGTGLPTRRGYYLGYLVAQEAAKSHDVRQLAKLECGKARELVYSTVRSLNTRLHQ